MKTTENYGLNKPELTDFYDVEKFNENADKIDSKLKDLDMPTYTIADFLEELKSGELLSTAFGKIARAVSMIGKTQIHTTTERTLAGSTAGGLKINHITGATEQKTLTGKNLFCKSTATSSSYISDSTGATSQSSDITGTYASEKISVSGLSSIYVTNTQTGNKWGAWYDSTGAYLSGINGYGCLAVPEGAEYVALTVRTEVLDTFQIEAGTVATDFEPYCGGTASPNPSYPQAIQNTGDCVEMIQGWYSGRNGNYEFSYNAICSKNPIPCKSGDVVKVELETTVSSVYLMHYGESGYITYATNGENAKSYEFTIPSNVTSFNIRINETGITPDTVGKISLTVNGKYVTGVNTLSDDITKDVSYEDGYFNASGELVTGTAWKHKMVEIDRNCNYRVCNGIPNSTVTYHCWYDSNNTFISNVGFYNISEQILTPPSNAKYLGISCVEAYPTTVQVIKSAYIYTTEPIRDSDVVFDDKGVWTVERNSHVLDLGTLSWNILSNGRKESYKLTEHIAKAITSTEVGDMLCTHYIADSYNNIFNGVNDKRIGFYVDGAYIEVSDSDYTDATEFKTAMSGVLLEYKLATPTYEVLDTASQLALNSLKTFDTVTHIEVDSRVQTSEVEVEYSKAKVGSLMLGAGNIAHRALTLAKNAVSKDKIANNLTTTEEGFVLDARIGIILDKKIDSTNDSIELLQTDLVNTKTKITNNSNAISGIETSMAGLIKVGTITPGDVGISVPANSVKTWSDTITPDDGYTVVGIVGVNIADSNVYINEFWIEEDAEVGELFAYVNVCNPTETAQVVFCGVNYLMVKTDFIG